MHVRGKKMKISILIPIFHIDKWFREIMFCLLNFLIWFPFFWKRHVMMPNWKPFQVPIVNGSWISLIQIFPYFWNFMIWCF